MRRAILLLAFLAVLLPSAARAEDPKPDDSVVFDLSTEDWVTTKTARVVIGVEAAVTGSTAGTMRASILKSVENLAKADWRLIGFDRAQDQTGLERWSAQLEARIPENELSGLNEAAKKNSKAGLQLTVRTVDFVPTLEEVQSKLTEMRAKLYKNANDQLSTLNAALPGKNYRIALIDFTPPTSAAPTNNARFYGTRAKASMLALAAPDSASEESTPMERSQKLTVTARLVLAAAPPVSAPAKP